MSESFVKMFRSPETAELFKHPAAFTLLAQIGFRAQRTDRPNLNCLRPGEALVGDCRSIGLTERRYRTAKNVLKRLGIATFRGTTQGTVATLCESTIFDINADPSDGQNDEQATNKRRTDDEQATNGATCQVTSRGDTVTPLALDLCDGYGRPSDEQTDDPRARSRRKCVGKATTTKNKEIRKKEDTPHTPIGGGQNRNLTQTQKRRRKIERNNPLMDRISSWFFACEHRWTFYEAEALKDLGALPEEEIGRMEAFYTAAISKGEGFRRQSIDTLLNNWSGELAKAERWARESNERPQNGTFNWGAPVEGEIVEVAE